MSDADPTKALAAALGRIPSGLFVLTAVDGPRETGMLASWVQQCSFNPPLLSVAVRPDRQVAGWLTAGAAFTINILDDTQTDMVAHFGRGFKPDEQAFTNLEVSRPGGAPPVLDDALAYLECRVESRCSAGDHDLILGRIIAGKVLGDGRPMVHVRKSGLHY
jgi:flavin reductase (DIM6/NTAB) family NADH-FMN oxidoreductase RutF